MSVKITEQTLRKEIAQQLFKISKYYYDKESIDMMKEQEIYIDRDGFVQWTLSFKATDPFESATILTTEQIQSILRYFINSKIEMTIENFSTFTEHFLNMKNIEESISMIGILVVF